MIYTRDDGQVKMYTADPAKKSLSLHDLLSIRRFDYNRPDGKLMHNSNHTEHYKK